MGVVSPEWDLQTPGWTHGDQFAADSSNFTTSHTDAPSITRNPSSHHLLSQNPSTTSLTENTFGFEHYNNTLNTSQEFKRRSVQEWTESVPLPEDLPHSGVSGAGPNGLKIFTGGSALSNPISYPGSAQLYPPVRDETSQLREIAACDRKGGAVEPAAFRKPYDTYIPSSPASHDSSPGSVFSQRTSASSLSSLSTSFSHQGQSAASQQQQRRAHPRRTQVSASWIKPTLVRQEERRRFLVDRLVECSTALVALVWPQSEPIKIVHDDNSKTQKALGLQGFIQETLRRSNTSYTTLQITLWYLTLLSAAKSHCGPSISSSSDSSLPRSLRCGRRMFLAALILASKFIQDRNYTARAWSKITGLTTREISSNEFAFLNAIHWNLHLRDNDYCRWHRVVVYCTEACMVGISAKQMWMEVLFYKHHGLGLEQIDDLIGKRKSISPQQWSVKIPILSSPYAGPRNQDGFIHLTPCGRPGTVSNCPQRSAAVVSEASRNGCASDSSFTFTQGVATPDRTPPMLHSWDGPSVPPSGKFQDVSFNNCKQVPSLHPTPSWLPTPISLSSASPTRWSNSQNLGASEDVSMKGVSDPQGQSQAWIEEQQNASNWINLLAEAAQMDGTTKANIPTQALTGTLCPGDTQSSIPYQAFEKSLEDGTRRPETAQRPRPMMDVRNGFAGVPTTSRDLSFTLQSSQDWRNNNSMNAHAPIDKVALSVPMTSHETDTFLASNNSRPVSHNVRGAPSASLKRSAPNGDLDQAPAVRRVKCD